MFRRGFNDDFIQNLSDRFNVVENTVGTNMPRFYPIEWRLTSLEKRLDYLEAKTQASSVPLASAPGLGEPEPAGAAGPTGLTAGLAEGAPKYTEDNNAANPFALPPLQDPETSIARLSMLQRGVENSHSVGLQSLCK